MDEQVQEILVGACRDVVMQTVDPSMLQRLAWWWVETGQLPWIELGSDPTDGIEAVYYCEMPLEWVRQVLMAVQTVVGG